MQGRYLTQDGAVFRIFLALGFSPDVWKLMVAIKLLKAKNKKCWDSENPQSIKMESIIKASNLL